MVNCVIFLIGLEWTYIERAALKRNAYNETFSGNSEFYRPKTIFEYSGLTAENGKWTRADGFLDLETKENIFFFLSKVFISIKYYVRVLWI